MTQEIKQIKWGMTMLKYKDFNGHYVLNETLELMDAIKKKNPLLTFQVGSNRIYRTDETDAEGKRIEIKTSMRVFDSKDSTKEIGQIGYDSDEKYWVRSRLIQNEKYGHWNRVQYESKFSKHMKNIVKEGLKALKPISYDEVKEETEGAVARIINSVGAQVRNMANTKSKVEFIDLFPELLHMHNIGFTPATPKMAEAIAYAVENKEKIEKYYHYNPKKCMIWVRPDSVVYEINKEVKQVNTTAELPEELRGKLFVLDVTDKGQFVEDVGIKQDTGIYWVLLEEK